MSNHGNLEETAVDTTKSFLASEKEHNMSDRNYTPPNQFFTELQGIALEYPHTAVISQSPKFNTVFYNVYFKSEVEKWLESLNLDPDYSFVLVGKLAASGYTVKLIPRNKHGYCQCSITRPQADKSEGMHVITGEAGKLHDACLSAFVKHILVLQDNGDSGDFWHGSELIGRDTKKFR